MESGSARKWPDGMCVLWCAVVCCVRCCAALCCGVLWCAALCRAFVFVSQARAAAAAEAERVAKDLAHKSVVEKDLYVLRCRHADVSRAFCIPRFMRVACDR